MPANATIFSPEVRRWGRRLHQSRLGSGGAGLTRVVARHLAWGEGIASRFGLTQQLRGHERPTALLRPRLRISRTSFRWHVVNASFPMQLVLARADESPQRSSRAGDIEASVSVSWQHHRVLHEVLHRRGRRLSIETMHRSQLFLRTLSVTPGGTEEQDALYGAGRTEGEEAPERMSVTTVQTLAHRLLRQTVRTERQVDPLRTVLLQRTAAPEHASETIDNNFLAQRGNGMVPQTMVRSEEPRARQTQPYVNVQQITDEVVRQLDSRLIASRERFGKI